MPRQYKLARKMCNKTIAIASEFFGVSQSTLSLWENGHSNPSLESLEKMSNYYHVTTDFLLGLETTCEGSALRYLKKLEADNDLYHLNHTPVHVDGYGWALVDTENELLRFSDGSSKPFIEAPPISYPPPPYTYATHPAGKLLNRPQLSDHSTVWVEPITPDAHLQAELRGWYHVKDRFVTNEFGQRFYFDNYYAKWVAFA